MKFKNFIKGRIAVIKKIPWWGWVWGVVLFGGQYGIYRLARALSVACNTTQWSFIPKIDVIDNAIPLISWFVIIYVFSYVFWIFGPIAVSLTSKKNFYDFVIGLLVCYVIGFFIFFLVPTYMDRDAEGISHIGDQGGFFDHLLQIVYDGDGGSLAWNLLPSFHCTLSLYMYFGVMKQKEISLSFRIYSLMLVILIMLSTLFTKQHYIIDVIVGLCLATFVFLIIKVVKPGEKILKHKEQQNKEQVIKNAQ